MKFMFRDIIGIYCNTRITFVNVFSGKMRFLNITAGGTSDYDWTI